MTAVSDTTRATHGDCKIEELETRHSQGSCPLKVGPRQEATINASAGFHIFTATMHVLLWAKKTPDCTGKPGARLKQRPPRFGKLRGLQKYTSGHFQNQLKQHKSKTKPSTLSLSRPAFKANQKKETKYVSGKKRRLRSSLGRKPAVWRKAEKQGCYQRRVSKT